MTVHDLGHFIPFIGIMTAHDRPFITRLIEQSLPGILVAGVGLGANDAVRAQQLESLKVELRELKIEVRGEIQQLRRDIYVTKSEALRNK